MSDKFFNPDEEIASSDDMIFDKTENGMFNNATEDAKIVIKSSIKPLIKLGDKEIRSCVQVFTKEGCIYHELWDVILTEKQCTEAMEKVKSNINLYKKIYGKEIDSKTE